MKKVIVILYAAFFCAFSQENYEIINADKLYPFFNKLKNIQNEKKVNIVHIGDSHVQGDFFSSVVRNFLQEEFGNGGLGYVFAYNLAKTNSESSGYVVFSSKDSWRSCRISKKASCSSDAEFGISGYSLSTQDIDFRILLEVPKHYKFDKITLFYTDDVSPFSLKNDLGAANMIGIEYEYKYFAKYSSAAPITNVSISRNNNYANYKSLNNYNFHGAFLENDSVGLIYSSIGVNGAKAVDFANNSMFLEHIAALSPDLIVVSFGTNEAFSDISSEVFVSQIEDLISKIIGKCTDATVLITTPPLSFMKKTETNFIHQYAQDIAKTKHYAVWDLHKLTHDLYSAANGSNTLFAKDKIHYSADGYRQTAALFANAILKNYKVFLKNMR
jgi:lysophospholipase L1-like esterase